MHRNRALALLAAVGLAAVASSANAATTLTVGPDSLCGPSGCFSNEKKVYTRTFSARELGGNSISSLSLFRDLTGLDANSNQAVRITFQLADGTEVVWGTYKVGAMAGEKFVTIGGQEVAWDAALGDLSVKLELVDLKKSGGGGGLGWFIGHGGGGGGGDEDSSLGGGGLSAPELPIGDIVTSGPLVRPSLPPQPIVAVPEPGAWALMIMGFGAAGAMLRRRRAVLPVQPQG
jgi:hypothetical protein